MDIEKKQRIIAEKKVFKTVHTTSVNKLEKMISENPNHEHRSVIALFAFLNKDGKLNPLKHPNLISLSEKFRLAVERAKEDDQFYEIYIEMKNSSQYKKRSKEFKMEVSRIVNKALKETNTSINALSERSEIKYSNLYNFLEKEKYSDLSLKNTYKILRISKSISQGWNSKEEAMLGMMEKWEILRKYIEEKEEEND